METFAMHKRKSVYHHMSMFSCPHPLPSFFYFSKRDCLAVVGFPLYRSLFIVLWWLGILSVCVCKANIY